MKAYLLRVILLGLLAGCPRPAAASTNDVEEAKARMEAIYTLKVGDAEDVVRQRLAQCQEKDLPSFAMEHVRLRQPLDGQRAAVWFVCTREGAAVHVITLFSKDRKLADLWSFIPPSRLVPILRGTYVERLESIRAGMSVDHVYQLVGEVAPVSYHRTTGSDKWLVGLMYMGVREEFWSYTADAASGLITHVSHQRGFGP
jgi:hypothetical protein